MSYEPTNENDTDNTEDPTTGPESPPPPAATATMPGPAPAPTVGVAPATAPGPNTARRAVAVLVITVFALVGAALFALALIVALIAGAVIGIAVDGDAEQLVYTPSVIDEVPTSIVSDEADVVIDLTGLSAADFDGRTEPVAMDIDVDFGSIQVIVPDDVTVAVDAETDIGSTSVFDQVDDGFDNRVIVSDSDADLDLTIDLGVGDVDVERG